MHLPLLPTIALTLSTITLTLADRNLYIIAHQDDDLLFLNPSLLHSIRDNHSIQTIYLTAGDAGLGPEYWTSRQAGALAAYAQMAGVSNTWDESGLEIPAGEIRLYTLRERAENPISLAFMHLPDGNGDGSGFAATGNESLEKLWKGAIGTISTVDESGISYTREELISALASVIDRYGPDSVSAQDYVDALGSGDHSDHTAGALFANEAAVRSSFGGSVAAYEGYPVKDLPANVGGADLDAKKAAFYTYAPYDSAACASDAACGGSEYELWLQREYLAN